MGFTKSAPLQFSFLPLAPVDWQAVKSFLITLAQPSNNNIRIVLFEIDFCLMPFIITAFKSELFFSKS